MNTIQIFCQFFILIFTDFKAIMNFMTLALRKSLIKNSICFVEWNSKVEEVGIKFNIIIELVLLKNNERNIYIKINN